MVTRRRTSSTRRRTTSTTRRRRSTTRRTGYGTTRRRTPKTSTTLGSAFALALIALFTQAPWPVRIGLIVVALVAVGAYLVIRARREAAPADEPEAEPPAAPLAEPSPDTDKDPSS